MPVGAARPGINTPSGEPRLQKYAVVRKLARKTLPFLSKKKKKAKTQGKMTQPSACNLFSCRGSSFPPGGPGFMRPCCLAAHHMSGSLETKQRPRKHSDPPVPNPTQLRVQVGGPRKEEASVRGKEPESPCGPSRRARPGVPEGFHF